MYGDEIVSVHKADNGYMVKGAKTDAEKKAAMAKAKAAMGKDGSMGAMPSSMDSGEPHTSVHENMKSAMVMIAHHMAKHGGKSADDQFKDDFNEAAKEHAGNKG